jgi:hypothetical protein
VPASCRPRLPFFFPEEGLKRQVLMRRSLFYIVLGTALIGAGGLILTHGWNLRSSVQNREALIEARSQEREHQRTVILRTLAAEYLTNTTALSNSVFDETDEELLRAYVIYPRLQSNGLTAALASGLFTHEEDRELFTRIVNLAAIVDSFNHRLLLTQQQMVGTVTTALWRRRMRDGVVLQQARTGVAEFGQLLLEDYKIKPDETFLAPLPPLPPSELAGGAGN